MRYELDIPGYHNREKCEDVPRVSVKMHVPAPLRVGEQMEVPDGGVVQIVNIRHRPIWSNGDKLLEATYGLYYAYSDGEPLVTASWVTRPGSKYRG